VAATTDDRIDGDRLHRTLMERAVQPTATPEDRARVIADILDLAGGRPEPIERARLEFHRRLTHRRDDLEATEGLRLTDGALGLVSRPAGPWRRQVRERGRQARRHRRRP
jgi:hypothetical protein